MLKFSKLLLKKLACCNDLIYCLTSFAILIKYGLISTPSICFTNLETYNEKNPQLLPISKTIFFFR